MEWLNANDIQPQDETGVVGYSKQWIDQNSNTKGIRICYYNNGNGHQSTIPKKRENSS